MKSIKLSECADTNNTFLYGEETVTIQYILRRIFNGVKIPDIYLCEDDDLFEDSITNMLFQMSNDVSNGIEKDGYSLKVNTTPVIIDITKDDIKQISTYVFKIKSRRNK